MDWENLYDLAVDYSPFILGISFGLIGGMAASNFFGGMIAGLLCAGSILLVVQKAADSTVNRVRALLQRRRP